MLAKEYGIKKGDKVAIIMRNRPDWIVVCFVTFPHDGDRSLRSSRHLSPRSACGLSNSSVQSLSPSTAGCRQRAWSTASSYPTRLSRSQMTSAHSNSGLKSPSSSRTASRPSLWQARKPLLAWLSLLRYCASMHREQKCPKSRSSRRTMRLSSLRAARLASQRLCSPPIACSSRTCSLWASRTAG